MAKYATFKQIEYIHMLRQDIPDDVYEEIKKNVRAKKDKIEELSIKSAGRLINALIIYKRTGEVKKSRTDTIAEMEESLRNLRRRLRNER